MMDKNNLEYEDILDQNINDEYITEMATIARDNTDGILISVNPERDRLSIPYFKVYDDTSFDKAKRVARLHFKDSGMEYHNDNKEPWILNSKDKKNIKYLLQKESKAHKGYTYWQYACFQWNYENGLIDDDIDKYFEGEYDHQYDNDSRLKEAYVPSDLEMPDTWNYDPAK